MNREKSEILETLKAENKPEIANAEILKVKDVPTKYGTKQVLTIQDTDAEAKFDLFLNTTSMNNLIDLFGNDDNLWLGKVVKISTEVDEKFGKNMIVVSGI